MDDTDRVSIIVTASRGHEAEAVACTVTLALSPHPPILMTLLKFSHRLGIR